MTVAIAWSLHAPDAEYPFIDLLVTGRYVAAIRAKREMLAEVFVAQRTNPESAHAHAVQATESREQAGYVITHPPRWLDIDGLLPVLLRAPRDWHTDARITGHVLAILSQGKLLTTGR